MLVCIGMWGWKSDELKYNLAECGFAKRIIFVGFVDLADLSLLYYYVDCFLYLSRCTGIPGFRFSKR